MVRSSEYAHSFRPKLEQYIGRYSENIDYRIQRRYREHAHYNGAFVWESDHDSDFSGDAPNSLRTPRVTSIPEHKQKFMKFTHRDVPALTKKPALHYDNAYNEQLNQAACNRENGVVYSRPASQMVDKEISVTEDLFARVKPFETDIQYIDHEVQTPNWIVSPVNKKIAATQLQGVYVDKAMQTKQNKGRRNNDRSKSAPVAYKAEERKMSTSDRTKNFHLPVEEIDSSVENSKPPFLLYGCKDSVLVTGTKKTHNVRASTAVREPALRAYKRRQIEIKRHEAKSGSVSANYQRTRDTVTNHFDETVRRATANWVSEYQQSFLPHSYKDYTTGAAATRPRRPKTPSSGNRLIATM